MMRSLLCGVVALLSSGIIIIRADAFQSPPPCGAIQRIAAPCRWSNAAKRIGRVPRGGGYVFAAAVPVTGDSTAAPADSPPFSSGEGMLRATAFTFVLGLSLTTLTPAPHLVGELGQVNGVRLLTALATTSAATEIGLSPIVGGLSDSVGRKPVLVGTLAVSLLAGIFAAVSPSVATISLQKFVNGAVIGIFFLAAGAILADKFRTEPQKLAASSGVLFALVNAGFGVGIALSGLLPPSLHLRYAASSVVCALGLALAAFGVRETMPDADRVPFKARAFNPFAFTRLLTAGEPGSAGRRTMRLLAALAALTLFPLFMGDVLQVFAVSQWSLTNVQVSSLFSFIAVSGVVSNLVGGTLIRKLGLRPFTALATASTLLLWIGFSTAHLQVALICAGVGFLGPARTLGATTMMTSEGAKLGIPQGQLSGDRANLVAWLKVVGPLVYGALYVRGVSAGVPQAPFLLNVVLTAAALVLGPIALAGGSADQGAGQQKKEVKM